MIGNEEETIYFALDSDAIINLALLHHYFPGGRNRQPFDEKMAYYLSNQSIMKSLPELTYAYQNFLFTRDENDNVVPIKKPRVKFVVPYTAFGEVCDYACKKENEIFREDFKELLCKTMLKFDDSKRKDKVEFISNLRGLARAYTQPFVCKGKKHDAPMPVILTGNKIGRIPSDSMIMAEATVHGIDLLTFNAKDYIFNDEVENISGRTRKFGICAINELRGYKKELSNANGEKEVVLPKPYHFSQVMKKFMSETEDTTFDFRVKPKTRRITPGEFERL
ncbi:MAG: hypothetical protein K6F08_00620 [bacterium]|nr:hypothetical protein [bacterium]